MSFVDKRGWLAWVLASSTAFASHPDVADGLNSVIEHQQTHAEMQLRLGSVMQCPPVNRLIKQGDDWYAEGGWHSWSGSMSQSLKAFVGARWQGAYTGAVSCYYDNSDTNVFPVTLIRSGVYRYPQGGKWKAGKKKGTMMCESDAPSDCSFQEVFYESKKLKNDAQVYELLDSIKKPD